MSEGVTFGIYGRLYCVAFATIILVLGHTLVYITL